MITFSTRLGIGFDIEHNENIIHLVGDDDDQIPAAFMGLIIKIPFLSCYIGDFYELDFT